MAQNNLIYNPADVSAMLLSEEGPKVFLLTASDNGKIVPNPDTKDEDHPYLHCFVPGTRGKTAENVKSFSQIGTLIDANKALDEAKRRTLRIALMKAAEPGATASGFGYGFTKRADGKFDVTARPVKNETGKEKTEKLDTYEFIKLVEAEERKANSKPRSS